MDEELDHFKRIDLCDYAARRGYRLVRRERTRGGGSRGSTASSILMRHPITDDKIVIRLDRDGHWTYFSVRDDRDNGTIIDFVQRRGANTLAQVRQELRAWAGYPHPGGAVEWSRPVVAAEKADRAVVREAFARAKLTSSHPYLNSRGIRPETLSCARFANTWRTDEWGDILFPHRDGPGTEDVCGFERKNARYAGFSAGGTKTLWTSNSRDDDASLVVTEAVIDAFSYHQLQQAAHARYASTSGSFGERQARHVAAVISRMPVGSIVVVATDNDDAGEKLAEGSSLWPATPAWCATARPWGKDWNECLQRSKSSPLGSAFRADLWTKLVTPPLQVSRAREIVGLRVRPQRVTIQFETGGAGGSRGAAGGVARLGHARVGDREAPRVRVELAAPAQVGGRPAAVNRCSLRLPAKCPLSRPSAARFGAIGRRIAPV